MSCPQTVDVVVRGRGRPRSQVPVSATHCGQRDGLPPKNADMIPFSPRRAQVAQREKWRARKVRILCGIFSLVLGEQASPPALMENENLHLRGRGARPRVRSAWLARIASPASAADTALPVRPTVSKPFAQERRSERSATSEKRKTRRRRRGVARNQRRPPRPTG